MVWFLICFSNSMTPNGKAKDGIYRRGVFFLCFFSLLMLRMKNENRYNGSYSYIPFFCFWIVKKEKETWLSHFHFHMESENKIRNDGIYNTWCFSVFLFSSCKRKNENRYNGSYFYFSFSVWRLGKMKRMISCPFSIFYYELEKRKTKGRYIHGPIICFKQLIIGRQTQNRNCIAAQWSNMKYSCTLIWPWQFAIGGFAVVQAPVELRNFQGHFKLPLRKSRGGVVGSKLLWWGGRRVGHKTTRATLGCSSAIYDKGQAIF